MELDDEEGAIPLRFVRRWAAFAKGTQFAKCAKRHKMQKFIKLSVFFGQTGVLFSENYFLF